MLFLLANRAFSQGQVKGRLIDSHKQPVEYASISIFKMEEEKPINGLLTDSTGTFVLKDLAAGNYFIKIEVLGYNPKLVKDISLSNNKLLDLGEITVQESANLLNEVVVNGEQEVNRNKIDKQVYKAAQFDAAKGGTAVDVLKNMPSVTVNAEGDIRLRGSTGFLVLINGKPVLTDISTVLNQLPANSIENVELITAPSAKYDADGKSGIINITTKKGKDDGLAFTLNGQYGLPSLDDYNNLEQPSRYGADASLNYKKNKWDFVLSGSYQQNDLAGRREGDVNTTVNNRYTSFPSVGERSFDRRNYAARATIVYTPNKNNYFSAGAYRGQRRQFRRADINYHNTKKDVTTDKPLSSFAYFNSNLVKKQGDFSLMNLDYVHTFQNKSTLTVSGLYEYALLDGYTKNLNASITDKLDTIDYVLNTGKSPLSGIRGKIDYAITIGKGKLESGYQLRYQKQTGEFLYQNYILGTGNYVTVPEFSANIDVDNTIPGIYSQYSGKLGELEYIGGLRYEYATRIFNADKLTHPYELNLSNLFPSVNLVYSLKQNFKLKAGFSKRVQRSTSNELNPYPEREHSETLEQGDPQILPEFVNLSELGLIKEFNSNGSVFITLYNQRIQNVVNRVNSVYNDTILNRIFTNAGTANLNGIEAGISVKPVKWWSIYLGGNVYDYRIKGALFNNAITVNNSGLAYSINANTAFQVLKTLSLQLNLNYLSERPTAQGEDSRFITPNLAVKKTFLNGKLAATVQWQNIGMGIIKSNEQRITTRGSNFFTTTNYIQEKDILWIHISYNFKQLNKKLKLPASEFGEKEF